MQITELSQDGLSRKLRVTVPAATLNDMVTARLRDAAKTVRLPGFRPGKVPLTVMRQRYGRSVLGEVVETAVQETSEKAVAEQGVRTAGQPKIELESYEDGGDLVYTVAFDALPDFDLIDFSTLKVERVVADIAIEEIDETVGRVAESRRSYTPVAEARPAQSGDQILIDFAGTVDGEAREGMTGKDHPLVLGSGQFIPGFEDQLMGVEADSHHTVTVSFPADYPAKDLAGREAVFEVDVKEVREGQDATVDDAFAESLGFDNLEELRDIVRRQLEGRYGEAARQLLKRNVLDALAEHYTFAAPQGMVEQEFDAIWKQIEKARESGELTDDDKARPEDDLRAEYRGIAERRVRLGLVLAEVGRRQSIEVGQDELSRALQAQAARYPGREQEILDLYRKNPGAMESLRAPILEEKVIDHIVDLAEVTERSVTPKALMAEAMDGDVGEGSADAGDPPQDAPADASGAAETADAAGDAPAAPQPDDAETPSGDGAAVQSAEDDTKSG